MVSRKPYSWGFLDLVGALANSPTVSLAEKTISIRGYVPGLRVMAYNHIV